MEEGYGPYSSSQVWLAASLSTVPKLEREVEGLIRVVRSTQESEATDDRIRTGAILPVVGLYDDEQ